MKPMMVNLYWGGQIVFKAGTGVCYDPPVTKCSTLIRDKLSYRELLDLVYNRVGITKEAFKVNMLFRYPASVGSNLFFSTWRLHDDETVDTFYEVVGQLESFLAELYIETEPLSNTVQQQHPQDKTNNSFVSLLDSYPSDIVDELQRNMSTSDRPERVVNENLVSLNGDKMYTGNEFNSLDGDKDGEDYDFDEGIELDGSAAPPSSNKESEEMHSASGSHNEGDPSDLNVQGMMSADNSGPTDRVWSEGSSEIQLGMRFEDKEQLKRAISLWSIKHGREYKVLRSNGGIWFADCKLEIEAVRGGNGLPGRMRCSWSVHAVRNYTLKMWEITKWVKEHRCIGEDRSSKHKNWTSSMIANRVQHLIEENPSYTVKSIQKYVKEEFGVTISYKKGWTAQQKAIELINSSKA